MELSRQIPYLSVELTGIEDERMFVIYPLEPVIELARCDAILVSSFLCRKATNKVVMQRSYDLFTAGFGVAQQKCKML
ncbi:hypothetical protein ALQ14_200014 [Pseudomonas savastanoi pv. glycinea]|uniref:Uncharacterized protein n=1 Tax=Pseudomonas savastanoi pv. glycinea TaxID=318 RepID=A0AB74AWY9_PSESG|nr:hypothetical protein ALQ14_200014 [Pseudomonas savastanoi pv. glycinea]RMQ04764.1 hypothetical protein ALQ13_200107 [Pseudomonas savastanoi pv. glycinea]RMQ08733.1 hypothetical protein ALQ11_200100 [Pseudomonas savastanoi pv. glycinea]RMR30341.1 hypothetical protein ALP88_200022 [Pseudomonas savastanoi pv. glycinea]RMU13459.1 hypothetical protein ALP34_200008 [Pseudomonas savastanoi pv. glycinea]